MMSDNSIQLPSNRKFGSFFCVVFGLAGFYFLFEESNLISLACFLTSLLILIITLVKDELLLPFNRLWMRFGLLLGIIVSPIILGIIFFGLFMPIATLMRVSGRDELKLKFSRKASYWISRSEPIKSESFKNQF